LLAHPFFAEPPPKSTGREAFNLTWASAFLDDSWPDQDVQTTFAELTARGIANAILRWLGPVDQVYVCGGGTRNADLLGRIHDLEVLIARTRAIQGSPNAPTLRVSADMDLLVRHLETECRRLHGRYIAARAPLLAICDYASGVPAPRRRTRAA
jgi:hypothetical protein